MLNKQEHIAPIHETKDAVLSMLMYYYDSHRAAGYSESDAKKKAAQLLDEIKAQYTQAAEIPLEASGSALTRLDRIIQKTEDVARENHEVRGIYNELLSLKAQLTKKRG